MFVKQNLHIVVAASQNPNGTLSIGKDMALPWGTVKPDMLHFKNLTTFTKNKSKANAIIMGVNTWQTLPKKQPLADRINVVVSTRNVQEVRDLYKIPTSVMLASSVEEACKRLSQEYSTLIENIYAIGGKKVYAEAMSLPNLMNVYMTLIDHVDPETYYDDADTFFPLNYSQFLDRFTFVTATDATLDTSSNVFCRFCEFENGALRHPEYQYLDLIRTVLANGAVRTDRTGVGTKSVFGHQMRFDLNAGFPLLTTKTTYWKGILEELLWFISGSTNAKDLSDKNVNIWNGNSSRDYLDSLGFTDRDVGDLGPVYGFQWRHFGANYSTMHANYNKCGIDQLKNVLTQIRETPDSRRIILTAWNPSDLNNMALPPCHCMCQFYVNDGKLSSHLYQRSCDIGLGVPFNIASYALLTHILAHCADLKVGELVYSMGDAHIYLNHVDAVKLQLTRVPHVFPTLKINERVKDFDLMNSNDFELSNYISHPKIKMEMSV